MNLLRATNIHSNIEKDLYHGMSEIDRTAKFFFIVFWNWSPVKAKIKSVWFRCFILGNAECILFSQDQDLSAVDLLDSSRTPLEWPFLLSLTQTELTPFLPWNLFMSCASFLRDSHNSPSSYCTGAGLNPQLSPASSSYQSLALDLSHPTHLAAVTWVLALPFLA